MHRILIVGALAEQLIAAGVRDVRALSQDPEAARLPLGVEVVRGDLTRP